MASPSSPDSQTNPFLEFGQMYGPTAGELGGVKLVREVFGANPDDWQIEVLKAFSRGDRRITIRSCNGPGKTCVAAWICWIELLTRFPQKTACTAPTAPQMFDALYAELRKWHGKLPPLLADHYEIKADRIELKAAPDRSFLTAKTARSEQPEAIQGIHEDEGYVLLVVDESSGVADQIFEAGAGSMSGPRVTTLLLSNPLRTTGYFFNTQHDVSGRWSQFHVSAVDGDHIRERSYVSHRVSQHFVDEIIADYGLDSNVYRVRVLGEFPRADYDGIIPYELVRLAQERDVEPNPFAPIVWGVDCARFGDDESALCKRQAHMVLEPIQTWRELDTMQLVGVLKAEWDGTYVKHRPEEILVDAIGIGAGVVDRLRELQLPARGINVSESPALNPQSYKDLRTELWFSARQWFAQRNCHIPVDRVLEQELVAVRYEPIESTGKMKAEPKSKTKKRLNPQRSPDRADSFILTFASTAATALHGGTQSWSAPLKRNLPGIV